MTGRIFAAVFAGLLSSSLAPAAAQSSQGRFRGEYVCEKLPTTRDILRVPIDLIVEGGKVEFARPLFNLNGRRVVGSEMAQGTIDPSGQMHLTSQWSYLGVAADAQYSGTLTPAGGTLTGMQTWSGPGADPIIRACAAALVPAPGLTAPKNPMKNPTDGN
jgi:hypothetical protein